MNLAQVARLLSGFVLFFSLAQLLPLAYAWMEPTPPAANIDPVAGYLAGLSFGLCAAGLLWLAGRKAKNEFFRREALAVVGFAWILAGIIGGIPFQWSGALPSAADALFETISGLTTTGASVLGSGGNYRIEDLPQSLLLWRSLIQWMGGLGIILVFVVLLPAMGVTGKNLLASEQIGVSSENLRPRMRDQARGLLRVYLFLTMAAVLCLWVLGGLGLFDSVCHSFTALATGGFSTRNGSVGDYESIVVELIFVVFMFLAGCNFALMAATARRGFRGHGTILGSAEFRLYAGLTAALVAAVTVVLYVGDHGGLGTCLRHAAFNVVSILTSTGYATDDFQQWPVLGVFLLWACMIVGGCAGSTAGGIKVVRLLVSFKLMSYTLRHFMRPKSVERIKLDGDVLPASVISPILALVLLWFASILAGAFVLALEPRVEFLSALSASTSMMGCTGPALCQVAPAADGSVQALGVDMGPYGGYGALHGATKVFMAFQMILGRLEILAPLVMLAPRFWIK